MPLPGKTMQTIYFSIRISTRFHHLGWSVQIRHLCNCKNIGNHSETSRIIRFLFNWSALFIWGFWKEFLLFNNHLDVSPPIGRLALTRNIPKWFKTFFPVWYVTSTRRLWHLYRFYLWYANKKHSRTYVYIYIHIMLVSVTYRVSHTKAGCWLMLVVHSCKNLNIS